ncbi:MAG: CehA/McbA family metallohydrolase [Trueperaceae bacterium]|nr:CehA/McbA family metallohydrolase [Trueperaceae bacterium]
MELKTSGSLSHLDKKRHIPIFFELEAGAKELELQFSYSPVEIAAALPINEISLSLFSPAGARGARHNNRDMNIRLSEVYASPGYVPGVLEPGRWCLVIDAHRILPGQVVTYDLSICSRANLSEFRLPEFSEGKTASRGPGWYRGDFHAHTYHSDARWEVSDLVHFARSQTLDFTTLSDHNTVSGLAEFHSYRADDLLTLGALELTTFYGHAVALGLNQWTEWRVNPPGGPGHTLQDLANRVEALGGIFIMAHPMSEGDPWCSGCHWGYEQMMPGTIRHIEVWNSSWEGSSHNEAALHLYYSWLNQGHRLVATAGTDIHRPAKQDHSLGFNCVYANDLTAEAILQGVRQGHLYLTNGPELELLVETASGTTFMMGDTVTETEGKLNLAWNNCQDFQLNLIVDGQVFQSWDSGGAGQEKLELNFAAKWLTLEVRNNRGELRALTNPIFFSHD